MDSQNKTSDELDSNSHSSSSKGGRARRAILYIAWGEKHLQLAIESAQSAAFMEIPSILMTDKENAAKLPEVTPFYRIMIIKIEEYGFLAKLKVFENLPEEFDSFLFLDVDTVVLKDVTFGFEMAEHHGMALAPASHYSLDHFWGFGRVMKHVGQQLRGQYQYNSGVIFFSRRPEVIAVLKLWKQFTHQLIDETHYKRVDQPFLTLAMEHLKFNPYTLAPTYNYRALTGEHISGDVLLWHSYHPVPNDINNYGKPWWPLRAYKDGKLVKRWNFKSIAKKVALVLTSLIMTLVLLESGLRLFGYSPYVVNVARIGRERVLQPFPGVRYIYKAHASYKQIWPDDPRNYFGNTDHSLQYRVNNYGFRGEDLELVRNHNLRIAVLGDSFCWGTGVKHDDIFTSLVENRLNQNRILGQTYELYNFCMPGYNTENEAALYKHVVRYFQPDLVLFAYFLNDINRPRENYFGWRGWESTYLWRLREQSRLLDFVVQSVSNIRAKSNFINNVNAAYQQGQPGFQSVIDGFEQISAISQHQKIPTALVIFPWLTDLERNLYPFRTAHQVVQQVASKAGFEVLDLFDVYADHNPEELWVHAVDQHPNQFAHKLAGEAIYLKLVNILTKSKASILSESMRRKQEPVSEHLLASPEKEWHLPFVEHNKSVNPKIN